MRRYSTLLLILVLLGSLTASQAAFAAAAPMLAPIPSTSAFHPSAAEEEESEAEEEEFEVLEEIEFEACEATAEDLEFAEMEEEEIEEFEEEVEECEEEAAKKQDGKGKAVTAPAACVVQRAESTIETLPGSDRVRLTLRYKDAASSAVAIQLKLKDQKGSLGLERTTKHFGRDGVLHLTTRLGETEMERALKAHEFDVGLRAPGTPGYCSDLLEQHLRKYAAKAHGSRVYSAPARG